MVRRLGSTILIMSLTGCAYRYGAGYYIANNQAPSVQPAPQEAHTAASAKPIEEDCEQVIEHLEVTNRLDNKNNTITTTAVTKRDRSRKCL